MKKNTLAAAAALALLLAACFFPAACGRPAPEGGPPGSENFVTIKGSDTMVHLVTSWAEAYMDVNPDANISVTGGGSGTGIAALLNGNTDICAASRETSGEEKQLAQQKNMDIKEYKVARDGIAVVVNPANPIPELTLEQLKKIYTGAVNDWSQVGGPPGQIVLLSRESSSGTYVFFQEHVLQKQDYAVDARLMPATSAIVQSVADDAQAIGYVGLGYALEAADRVKILAVKANETAPAVLPSEETIRSGAYSIARPLYYYVAAPVSEAVAGFIEFCLSPPGQKIVKEIGYIAVS